MMAIDINFNDDYKVERKTFPRLHYFVFFLAQLLVFLVMMMVLVMLETVISD